MGTIPRFHEVENSPAERTPAVDAFFDSVRQEQGRYLAAVRNAASVLCREPGHLGCVAAVHGRLTQQFFDAQRLILIRRAEVDAEVARIGMTAEDDADAVLHEATSQAIASAGVDRVTILRRTDRTSSVRAVDAATASGSPRQQIAALGAVVVHTSADAEALAGVINAAFEPDEPDGAVAQRQLTSMLDDWWAHENQEGRAAIDDAHARAAMRLHVARVRAGEIAPALDAPVVEVPVVEMPTVESAAVAVVQSRPTRSVNTATPVLLASAMVAIDNADPSDLATLFETLSASLQPVVPSLPSVVGTVAPTKVSDLVIRLDRAAISFEAPANGPEETFHRFWSKGSSPDEAKQSLGRIPVRVVLPMAATMSAIALLMAWIG